MAHEDDVNDWGLGSGFELDGLKVEVTKVVFGANNAISTDQMFAIFTFTPLEGGEDIEQSFSLGKGWEPDRTGRTIVHESGKPRKLNMQSNFGRLLGSAMDLFAGPKEDGESDADYQQRRMEAAAEILGSPRNADNWVGTMWEMGTIEREVFNPSTKETKMGTAFVFTEWLGEGIGDGGAEPEKTTKPATKAAGTTKTATRSVGGRGRKPAIPDGIEEELWQRLLDFAVEVQDRDADNEHEDFATAAMDLDGVDGNRAAQKAIMSAKAGSVWDAAKKAPRTED